MASDKQIAANRLNAQKCCGPTTPAGRAISSRNALKTGLDAQNEIIEGCESRSERDDLTARYYARYAPATEEESCLLDTAIASEWLQRRYLAVESRLWARAMDESETGTLGEAFDTSASVFSRVGARLNAVHRNYSSAMKHLQALRAQRGADAVGNIPVESDSANSSCESEATQHSTAPLLDSTVPISFTAPPATSRDCKGAVPEPPEPPEAPQSALATKPLNPKLVSFLQSPYLADATPAEPIEKRRPHEDDPPIAA